MARRAAVALHDQATLCLRRGEALEGTRDLPSAHVAYLQGIEILLEAIRSCPDATLKDRWRKEATLYLKQAEDLKADLSSGGRRHAAPRRAASSGKRASPAKARPAVAAAGSRRSARLNGTGRSGPSSAASSSSAHARPGGGAGGPARKRARSDDGQAVSSDMRERIASEIVRSENVRFEDVAGLEDVKQTLTEAVILPHLRRDLFQGLRAPPRGLLLFGPPGNGKTMIAQALATETDATFFSIKASSLTSKYHGDGEKLVRALFDVARERQPSIIFIDEVDSMLSARGQGEHDASRRLKTEFLVQLEGVGTASDDDRILVVGATNLPQEIDEAVLRRFQKKILVPMPDPVTRRALLTHLMRTQPTDLTHRDWDVLVQRTNLYSGSDLRHLCKDAAMGPIRDLGPEAVRNARLADMPRVGLRHFLQSLDAVRPSVSEASLAFYADYDEKYGSHAAGFRRAAPPQQRESAAAAPAGPQLPRAASASAAPVGAGGMSPAVSEAAARGAKRLVSHVPVSQARQHVQQLEDAPPDERKGLLNRWLGL